MHDFSIELFNSQKEIIQKTIDQINKDFAGFAPLLNIDLTANTSYQYIQEQIAEVLKNIVKEGTYKLNSLLYRIDMPEKFFPEQATKTNYFLMLADAIIRREYFKVTARIKFSNNQ